MIAPGDLAERERAATTFDRNVVVMAGAGTGKTTLLVDRVMHLLVREPNPLAIGEIVALTFTNKAASDLRTRLRRRLERVRALVGGEPSVSEEAGTTRSDLQGWIDRYRVSASEILARVDAALRDLDRAQIGTLHGFAATLLRLYPLDAGLDPRFREADQWRWREHVERCWARWLGRELTLDAPRADLWRRLLARLALTDVREVAWMLCAETVPLDGLPDDGGFPSIGPWLTGALAEVHELLRTHPDHRKIERQLAAAERVLVQAIDRVFVDRGSEDARLLRDESSRPTGWEDADFARAKGLLALARRLTDVDEEVIGWLAQAVDPFVRACRADFRRSGWLSFDGLLVAARDLLRDRPAVRAALKRRYGALLIDESQDVDPIQYEILLYLGEATPHAATHWRDVRLEPGKLFIVGDPKQSIYRFRGADIEAYQNIVAMLSDQGAIECPLSENFRSHAGLLRAINGVCAHLIDFQPGLQPRYEAVHSGSAVRTGPAPEIRLVDAGGGRVSADEARRAEAESLARWLSEEVLSRAEITERDGRRRVVGPKDIAILMRALTEVHIVLDALRRWDIRYVVEGEKHFYETQEVIDAINLMRAIHSPDDTAALVGVLRSPLGGATDRELYELSRAGLLDYRVVDRAADPPATAPTVLYRELSALHRDLRRLPVGEAVAAIFERLPVMVLAAGGGNADQVMANLEKVRRVAETLAEDGARSFGAVIRVLQRSVLSGIDEGEELLADEHVDAVKVMSIHKAKGLEFPVVVLAGAHAGVDGRQTPTLIHDWSSGVVGIRTDGAASLVGVYLTDQLRAREAAESRRLLYVAMTRARERLVISGVTTGRVGPGSVLDLLEEALGPFAGTLQDADLPVGEGTVRVRVIPAVQADSLATPPLNAGTPLAESEALLARWEDRRRRYERVMGTAAHLSPTALVRRAQTDHAYRTGSAPQTASSRGTPRVSARELGIIAHRFLQSWNYSGEARTWREALSRFAALTDPHDRGGVLTNLAAVLAPFFASPLYSELAAARIIGREVPLIMPWEDAIMEGVIDLIYEDRGRLYVADYKSDVLTRDEARGVAERYRRQAEVYVRAVRESLKRDVAGFRCLFLRLGTAVDLDVG